MISAIVATDETGAIGKDGSLPWYLPSDLKRFKQLTMGHPIIMGRKTHQSIGRALPGRTNIIISGNDRYEAEGCLVVNSLDTALEKAAAAPGHEEIFIIGGQAIFELSLPQISRIYLTLIHHRFDGDKFFNYDKSQWKIVNQEAHAAGAEDKYAYDFRVLERA